MAATDAKGPIDRATQPPFLIRTFIKPHAHHRIISFEGQLPIADELQVYTWTDATLREILLTLRSISSPNHTDLQHPLAKYTFRAVYPDTSAGGGGRFQTKDLGTVFARDLSNVPVLSDPFDPDSEPRNGDAMEMDKEERARREREERTLEQMRFFPGDYLDIAVILPKSAAAPGGHAGGPGLQIKGAVAAAAAANPLNGGPRSAPGADRWAPGVGRGGPAAGGHWRGGGPAPAGPSGRGGAPSGFVASRGGFGRDRERERDRDRDRDVPPPREPRLLRERTLREEKRERDERDDRPSRFERERRVRELRDDRQRGDRDRSREYDRGPRNTRRATPPRRGGGGQAGRRKSYTRSLSGSRSRSRSFSPRRRRSRSRD